MARKPRMAPTTMKTVPSGRVETCMYGAFDVGGTEGATILYSPVIDGRPVRAPPVVAELPPVIVGMVPVADTEEPPVIATVLDWIDLLCDAVAESVLVPVAEPVWDVAAASLSDFAADERLGTPPVDEVAAEMGAARSVAAVRTK
jgi:hypothetical protein